MQKSKLPNRQEQRNKPNVCKCIDMEKGTTEERRRVDFIKTIESQYTNFCKSREIKPTTKGFAEYLINRNLIPDLTIKRFLVVDKYPHALGEHLFNKQSAMWSLEDTIGVSVTSIKTYLKRFNKTFRLKNRLIPKS
jgi:hypothetical protein